MHVTCVKCSSDSFTRSNHRHSNGQRNHHRASIQIVIIFLFGADVDLDFWKGNLLPLLYALVLPQWMVTSCGNRRTCIHMNCFTRRRPKWVVFGHAGAESKPKSKYICVHVRRFEFADIYNAYAYVQFRTN